MSRPPLSRSTGSGSSDTRTRTEQERRSTLSVQSPMMSCIHDTGPPDSRDSEGGFQNDR